MGMRHTFWLTVRVEDRHQLRGLHPFLDHFHNTLNGGESSILSGYIIMTSSWHHTQELKNTAITTYKSFHTELVATDANSIVLVNDIFSFTVRAHWTSQWNVQNSTSGGSVEHRLLHRLVVCRVVAYLLLDISVSDDIVSYNPTMYCTLW